MKNWHIIQTYTHKTETILCVCGWVGKAGDPWMAHRKENVNDPRPQGFNKKNYVYAPGFNLRTTNRPKELV